MEEPSHENGIDHGLASRINDAKEQINKAAETPLRRRSQLEQFMTSTASMLAMHRAKIIEAESAYQLERLKLLDGYRIRLEQLKNDCADAVQELDRRYRNDVSEAAQLMNRLTAMRALD